MSQTVATIILTGFMSGVLLRSFVGFGWVFVGLLVFLGGIFGIISFAFENKKLALILVLFLFSAGLGIGRYEIKDTRAGLDFLEQQVGAQVELEGIVVEEPDERENYARLVVSVSSATKVKPSQDQHGTRRPVFGQKKAKVLIYARHYPRFQYGDLLKIKGQLKKPKDFDESFSWQDYLAKDDIYFEVFYPNIELLAEGQGGKIKEKLLSLKQGYLDNLNKVIPEPHSSFMGGLTVGAKRGMPKGLQEDFRKTGVIHMVVLSGYNITLVADTFMRVFAFLSPLLGMIFGCIGIIFFAIMTGASATVIRASFMAVLVILARWTGRIYTITWALFLAAFFMVLYNPKILIFDSGFQLSFMATLALIYLSPCIEKRFGFVTKKWQLREIFSSTVATQIFVLPLLLYKMRMFSVVSLPVNFLVLVFIPITMFFGFLTGGVGMISTVLSVPFGWVSYIFLQYELFVVNLFAKLPFASFTVEYFPLWLMLGIYVAYGAITRKIKKNISTSL